MTPQELMQQEILRKYQDAANNDADVKQAQDDAKRQAVVSAIASALDTAARAQAHSRGGEGSDPTFFNNLVTNKADAVKQAILARQNKLQGLVDQNSLVNSSIDNDLKSKIFGASEKKDQISADQSDAKLSEEIRRNKADEALRARELGIKDKSVDNKATTSGSTITEKAFEKTAGEDLANWSAQGGREAADNSINQLKSIRDRLLADKNNNISGGIINKAASLFGDTGAKARDLINPETSATNQEIGSAVLPGMKAMFPGATSDTELKTFMQLSFDPRLSSQENAKKLDEQIKKLETRRNKFARSEEEYLKTGKLTPQSASGPTKAVIKKEYSPSRNQTRTTYSDGSIEITDGQ